MKTPFLKNPVFKIQVMRRECTKTYLLSIEYLFKNRKIKYWILK